MPLVLTLNGDSELLECGRGGTYSDPGAQAVDGCGDALVMHAYNKGADSSGCPAELRGHVHRLLLRVGRCGADGERLPNGERG